MDNSVLNPGGTLGIIGNSTNGVALVIAARNAGINVGVYGDNENTETMELADFRVVGALNDQQQLQNFAERCDVVTYESETIDASVVNFIASKTRVPQGADALEIMQDRSLERAFFSQLNLNVAPSATIVSLDDVYQSIGSIGYPSILKPIQKGLGQNRQLEIKTQTDIVKAADLLDWGTYLLESLIPFDKELSVIVAKNDNATEFFPIVENRYRNHELMATIAPAQIDQAVSDEILRITKQISDNLIYTGVFEVAFFLTQSGNLYVKRIVPAMHQAGYVFDRATNISMAEQHLRAIAGLPLTPVKQLLPVVAVYFTPAQVTGVKTQWQLKPNWYFNFYHRTMLQAEKAPIAGHVLVEADTVKEALDQIDDTALWRLNPVAPIEDNPDSDAN
ncbi:5-(carboxyamino)imidazole ribonucleotide synthase [Lactiplantibacillus fabifermentans]|uniref:Phosphoribosylaminoimidazole carboxylase, ATPase subunit n=2 Tax=Lactiplantibacillus fabifermentans TaxID=483011 RepID=A0A0R2NXG2_9LACO|nr:ATP-grasp domain-containing protein [Lactiplantibacillus fabifermentans]ETY74827.1 phosphoribosylaminoimidazole carboxylase [Lactiplantibacillus fabifermentans T30PCM01]KRO28413.1 phosphoribosylaminoimidazole carboxylase, ATPase subunit [Lactiplantibacillus fabifermentans DSM 21115]